MTDNTKRNLRDIFVERLELMCTEVKKNPDNKLDMFSMGERSFAIHVLEMIEGYELNKIIKKGQ